MSTAQSPNDIPQWTVPDRLRKAREHAGLSQDAIATALDVTRKTIGNYENGRTAPRRTVLIAWAMATGVPIEWILTGETPDSGPDGPGELGRSSTRWYAEAPGGTVHTLHPATTSEAA